MNVVMVIEEMKRQNLLDWHDDNTYISIGDNSDWTTLKVKNGTKPTLSTATSIWDEIKDNVQANLDNIAAKQELSDGATTSKKSWALIKTFNDSLESVFETYGSVSHQTFFDNGYSAWRTIYDALPVEMQVRIQGFTDFFSNPSESFSFEEPLVMTNSYKEKFMLYIRDFLEYITDRAQT